jgi:hypothetical protein
VRGRGAVVFVRCLARAKPCSDWSCGAQTICILRFPFRERRLSVVCLKERERRVGLDEGQA